MITHLYKLILFYYNENIGERKKFKSFGILYDEMNKNERVKERVNRKLSRFGITSKDIDMMVEYKRCRNDIVHKWTPLQIQHTEQTEQAEQTQRATRDAINRLNIASDHTTIIMQPELKSSLTKFIEKLYYPEHLRLL